MPNGTRVSKDEFTEVDTRTIDRRARLTLGALTAENKRFRISINKDGDILLQPVVEIPASEAWLFKNREALDSVKKGLSDAAAGRLKKIKPGDL